MSLNVEKIAQLARICLSDNEKKKIGDDLEAILSYIEKLKTLNTDKIEPTSHVMNLEDVYRKDEVKPSDVIDDVLKHAPHKEGRFFKVPKVVERE